MRKGRKVYEIFDLGMYQTDAKAERCAATVSGCHCMERIDLFASNFASVPYQSATAATARVWREGEGTKVNNVMWGAYFLTVHCVAMGHRKNYLTSGMGYLLDNMFNTFKKFARSVIRKPSDKSATQLEKFTRLVIREPSEKGASQLKKFQGHQEHFQ